MMSTNSFFFFLFCVIAVGHASIRGPQRRLRELADESAAASYQNILSNMDTVTIKKIHKRFLMEKTAVENDARELQEEASMSLSLSLRTSSEAAVEADIAEADVAVVVGSTKSTKKDNRTPSSSKAAKSDQRKR
jgi:hypothetical protein